MEEERKVFRIPKDLMNRMRWLLEHQERMGQPVPTLQEFYNKAIDIGLSQMEATGKLPDPSTKPPEVVVELPVARIGRPRKSSREPIRTYLHGDPVVGKDGQYYCKRCDMFIPADHFERCKLSPVVLYGSRRQVTHEYKYLLERRRWFGESLKSHCCRGTLVAVDDPGNLFRTGTVREQHLPKLEKA